MISAIIPTLNAEASLARTFSALIPAAVEGLVREVIVADGGSTDATLKIVEDAGAAAVVSEAGRGQQLRAGIARARFPWLLILHADTVLEPGWEQPASDFMERVTEGSRPPAAAVFRFALDDTGFAPRALETLVGLRTSLFGLPYGDQGLLIPRHLYDEVGGYRPLSIMEDVDLVRRVGRKRLVNLQARAVTSAARFRRDGYLNRSLRNLCCLSLYYAGASPERIAATYGVAPASKTRTA